MRHGVVGGAGFGGGPALLVFTSFAGRTLIMDGDWITKKGIRIFWLEPERRTMQYAVQMSCSTMGQA